ncbi:cohesin domain-containing protein, partial [Ruminococcus flavefaciens]
MIKRIISVLLSAVLSLCLLPTAVFAASDMMLSAESVTAECKPGTEISIPVTAEVNSGYIAGTVDIVWDRTVLKLRSVAYTDNAPDNGSAEISQGRYRVSFGENLKTENFTGSGEFFTLTFTVTETAKAGDHLVALENAVIYNTDLKALSVSLGSANVTLTGETSENDLLLEIGSVNAPVKGDGEIRVPVTAKQNPGFVSGTADLKWNADALTLKKIEYTSLAPDNGSADVIGGGSYRIAFGNNLAEA